MINECLISNILKPKENAFELQTKRDRQQHLLPIDCQQKLSIILIYFAAHQ